MIAAAGFFRRVTIAAVLTLITVLCCQGENPTALVRLAVASLRAKPAHSSEMETQALMGTPVSVKSRAGEWLWVELPDGYEAYIPASAVVELDSAALASWRSAERLISVSPFEGHVFEEADTDSPVVSDIVLGCIVEGMKDADHGFVRVKLPDGRTGWVLSDDVAPLGQWMNRRVEARRILDVARQLTGSAYLWGGRSTKGVDCSGLTQLCYFDSGIMIPRNASAQALVGEEVENLQPADMLFFANAQGKVTHVALYETDSLYIHSSGFVHRSSMVEKHPLYNGRKVTSARRIIGKHPRVADHPWYFNR